MLFWMYTVWMLGKVDFHIDKGVGKETEKEKEREIEWEWDWVERVS